MFALEKEAAEYFKEVLAEEVSTDPSRALTRASNVFGIPLHVAQAIHSNDSYDMGATNARKILTVKANRMKNKNRRDTLAVVESNQYKGGRKTFDKPYRRHVNSSNTMLPL